MNLSLNICLVAANDVMEHLAFPGNIDFAADDQGAFHGSALVNIRRKALLSSVGFRKRMTSRSPRGSPCDSCKLRFDRPLPFV